MICIETPSLAVSIRLNRAGLELKMVRNSLCCDEDVSNLIERGRDFATERLDSENFQKFSGNSVAMVIE